MCFWGFTALGSSFQTSARGQASETSWSPGIWVCCILYSHGVNTIHSGQNSFSPYDIELHLILSSSSIDHSNLEELNLSELSSHKQELGGS